MTRLPARILREAYRREALPARVLWWFAARGMIEWSRAVASELRAHVGDAARPILARSLGRMFERRAAVLSAPMAPGSRARARGVLAVRGRDVGLVMSALYRAQLRPKVAWMFAEVGGPPKNPLEHLRTARLLHGLSARARWDEVATHLGELLVVLTEDLPAELPHARKVLGDLCFRAGVRFAEQTQRVFGISREPRNAPEQAIEVLRMSEYVFQVNPEHWGEAHAESRTGFLEGTACPWYERPGWNGAHCGIFGQFQSGIASVYGLKYHLAKTIPKHGGTTCRIDLKPLPVASLLRRELASETTSVGGGARGGRDPSPGEA